MERGDYEVIRAEDSQAINCLGFAVESGMVLEMSIVMRRTTSQENIEKCPRCGHLNSNATADNSWIAWQVPEFLFTL